MIIYINIFVQKLRRRNSVRDPFHRHSQRERVRNIGAKLPIDQADADKLIAQAKAEERRAMAVALEQEMRARVVEAEAEVPRAMAAAFRQGNLGIMDYYKMKNVQADTAMREAIAEGGESHPAATPRN